MAREGALLGDVCRLLLDGAAVAAPVKRVIIAQDIVGRAETSIDETIWQVLDEVGPLLPEPERMDVAGDDIDAWRDAFRVIQGFEIQSTLMPFALSHANGLAPPIRERFEIASRVTAEEAKSAGAVRAAAAKRLGELLAPGTILALPTTPTLPPERDIPDGASFSEFRSETLAATCLAGHAGLPQISLPAGTAAGCPVGLSFIGWKGGDEALLEIAVRLAPLLRESEERS
jgi:amidase